MKGNQSEFVKRNWDFFFKEMLTLLFITSVMDEESWCNAADLEHLRNSLLKIKGHQMNSHRIRSKMELWI